MTGTTLNGRSCIHSCIIVDLGGIMNLTKRKITYFILAALVILSLVLLPIGINANSQSADYNISTTSATSGELKDGTYRVDFDSSTMGMASKFFEHYVIIEKSGDNVTLTMTQSKANPILKKIDIIVDGKPVPKEEETRDGVTYRKYSVDESIFHGQINFSANDGFKKFYIVVDISNLVTATEEDMVAEAQGGLPFWAIPVIVVSVVVVIAAVTTTTVILVKKKKKANKINMEE